jgi:hypothetical protein
MFKNDQEEEEGILKNVQIERKYVCVRNIQVDMERERK